MMKHYKEDTLLSYYYEELDASSMKEIQAHLDDCEICMQYVSMLKAMEGALDRLDTALPASNTFDLVMDSIEKESMKRTEVVEKKPVMPNWLFAFFVLGLFSIVYFFHSAIAALPWLAPLEQIGIWAGLGSLIKTILLFTIIGLFASLAMAPVLVMEGEDN
ncbi:hypothetical protein QQ008_00450 [Fulvivirgaceae bacterium BMA10]|uniref:Zinc-finger domain-containing protein n=1 Tax=Splendidivirga corallicola TaxID=3051826 RepID=A0ABT8KH85_9BACT|nr:hypothetical protein [Fulvivirgaceae bacterium BMA10]